MEKRVLLSISGNKINTEGNSDYVELVTEGRLYKKDDVYCLEYEESELFGIKGTKTTVSIDNKAIYLERSGAVHNHFVFERGKKFVNLHQTPFGNVEMGIYSTKIHTDIGEATGSLDIRYQLDIGGQYTSLNELSFSYKSN